MTSQVPDLAYQADLPRPAYFARLSERLWQFARIYAETGDAALAMRAVGYKRSDGSRLLDKPLVRDAVAWWTERRAMPATEVRARLADIARGDIGLMLDDEGNFDLDLARRRGLTKLIKRMRIAESDNGRRRIEVEMYDALTALLNIAKAYGMLVERSETTHHVRVYIPDNGRSAEAVDAE